MRDADWNVVWVCQWEGEGGSSIHDTPEDAREYGANRGDDEPFKVFPIRLQRWVLAVESLPPDGVQVLARSITGRQFQCAYCQAYGGWRDYDGSYWSRSHVTHWMPTLVEPVEWGLSDIHLARLQQERRDAGFGDDEII